MKKIIVNIICSFIFNKKLRTSLRNNLLRPNSFIRLVNKDYKQFKLGVSYNLFDGDELLPFNLKNIRSEAHHISVVYQTVSNFGNSADSSIVEKLNDLVRDGLIDELYHYDPDLNKNAHWNEIEKRNIGVNISAKNNCTHFINCDVDEFYDLDSVRFAKKFIEDNDVDISAVPYYNYIRLPIYREKNITGYVPFICRIVDGVCLGPNYFPCRVDPTRAVKSEGRFYIFEPKQVMMHHMTTVRRDIDKKLSNTTYRNVNKGEFAKYNNYFGSASKFEYGINTEFDVDVVNNTFGIEL